MIVVGITRVFSRFYIGKDAYEPSAHRLKRKFRARTYKPGFWPFFKGRPHLFPLAL